MGTLPNYLAFPFLPFLFRFPHNPPPTRRKVSPFAFDDRGMVVIRCVPVSFFFIPLLLTPIAFTSLSLNAFPSDSNITSHILQDVLKAISARQKWTLEDVRVSKLDVGKVRFGTAQSYEFRVGSGKDNLRLKFSDTVDSWNKFKKPMPDLGSLISQVNSLAVLDAFELEGPLELRADSHHLLSLSLPMNTSYVGLKHILVGEGITVEIRRAQGVSLFQSSDYGLQINISTVLIKSKSAFWPFRESMCMPLLPVHIVGDASLVAFRTRNPNAYIETSYISNDTIELLPEKCYRGHIYRRQICRINFLSLRLGVLEKVLRSLLGDRIHQNQLFGFIKANIKASPAIMFHVELEREFRSNATLNGARAEWRTQPHVERIWFEITARVESLKLQPILIKKMKPFIESDSVSWSNLMSNVSFTKLRSVLVPSEALTLDVKW